MKKRAAIIVAAPHVCVESQRVDPGCDKSTRAVAQKLYHRLEVEVEEKGALFDLFLLESDRPRSACDMNRSACRLQPYRVRLRELLSKYGENAIVLEIHSFAPDYDWLSSDHSRAAPLDKRSDIVLLAEAKPSALTSAVAKALRAENILGATEHEQRVYALGLFPLAVSRIALQRRGPVVRVLRGAPENDIGLEARTEYGAQHALIEFRDDFRECEIEALTNAIAGAVVAQIR